MNSLTGINFQTSNSIIVVSLSEKIVTSLPLISSGFFLLFIPKTCVDSISKDGLAEAIQMSTNLICFYEDL